MLVLYTLLLIALNENYKDTPQLVWRIINWVLEKCNSLSMQMIVILIMSTWDNITNLFLEEQNVSHYFFRIQELCSVVPQYVLS